MIDLDQAARFRSMEQNGPQLRAAFDALTTAHRFFQGVGELKSISVSDVLDNASIEATFQGTRIKFELMLVFGHDHSPRGRVVCIHCHCTYGEPVQERLGWFSFGTDGMTDLDPDQDGHYPNLHRDAPAIVLRFLEAAFSANKML